MSSASHMTTDCKRDIRRECLKKRKALEPATVAGNSRAIEVILAGSGLLRDASAVLVYVSARDNEVDTHGIIGGLLAGGKTVYVPVTDLERKAMQWSRLLSMEELEPVHFGLLEPAARFRRVTANPMAEVCLVPGVAFTRSGWRIGYGGGYFDRFLDIFSGVPIGLAHDIQVVDRIPTDAHDRPVDYLVTESGIMNCLELRNLGLTGG